MIKAVYFYNDDDRVIALCKACEKKHEGVELIDKAGDWDSCGDCEAQNVPSYYSEKPPFISGTMN